MSSTKTEHSGGLLESLPHPPDHLNETGHLHYCNYGGVLIRRGQMYEDMLPTLIDLAWWEQLLDQHRRKVDKDAAVHEYFNEDGSLKHSQPTGWFSNIKVIQEKVRSLRSDLGLTPEKAKQAQPKQPTGKNNPATKNF